MSEYKEKNEQKVNADHNSVAVGKISIDGDVSGNIIIGNTTNIYNLAESETPLSSAEIEAGLIKFAEHLPERAPVLEMEFAAHAKELRGTLGVDARALSPQLKKKREENLEAVQAMSLEALDISFHALCSGQNPPPYDSRSPFRGLESFRPEDREFFFGREELTRKLVGKIQAHSFLAVLGASGSGKSSLVMAGVIPSLDLNYAIIRPGTNPLETLDSARGKSLLVVDQFEELFTLTGDEKIRVDFISALLDLTTSSKVIITLRSDFMGEVATIRSLNDEVQNHLENVPPMNADELSRAMEGQARWGRLEFEADLSQQILDDVAGEPGAMSLLQHTLWELWNRRHGRYLRAEEYRAFGGVKQAITSTAEKLYSACSKPEQEQLHDIFLRLTRLDEGDEGRDTRRRAQLRDLFPSGVDTDSISALLDKLVNARLIVKTVDDDKTEIEVSHEALIRHWERLRIWLNEDRDYLRLRESVSEYAREWDRSGRHESLLNYRWVKLDEALLLAKDSRYRLTDIEQAYLKGCVLLRNKEQREREKRLRYTVFASISVAVVFLILGGFALIKNNESEQQTKLAVSQKLSSQAQFMGDSPLSLTLLIQSYKLVPSKEVAVIIADRLDHVTSSPKANSFRVTSAVFSPNGRTVIFGTYEGIKIWSSITEYEIFNLPLDEGVVSLAISPDGKLVVSGGWDGIARVWDISTGKEISHMSHGNVNFPSPPTSYNGTVREPSPEVGSVAFSPDGKLVLTGSGDSTARIWDSFTGKEIIRMYHGGEALPYIYDPEVNQVAFSPNGDYVVSGSSGTARVWDVATGKEIARVTSDNYVTSVAYSPDGKLVVSGDWDGIVRVWDSITGNEISRLNFNGLVTSAAFSPNGNYVAAGSIDRTARVLEIRTGREIGITTDDASVTSIAFSPDEKFIALGDDNGTVRVWDILTGQEIIRFKNQYSIISIGFSSDNTHIVSIDIYGNVRYREWPLNNLIEYACIVAQHNLTRAEWNQYIGDVLPYQAVCPNLPVESESAP